MLNFKFKDENSENVKAVRVNKVGFQLTSNKNRAFLLGGGGTTMYIVVYVFAKFKNFCK